MDYRRIIPCLDVKDGRLVKGINFVELKDVGDPAENAAVYSQAGADKLVFLDITATLEKRKTILDTVKKTVERISVPLTIGGGIGSCEAIEELLDIGASKVSVNTAAVQNPDFIKEAADEFGSEKITVAIDTSSNSQLPSGFEVIVTGGTIGTGIDAVEWAKRVEDLGAGAILPTSMDADGTQAGYDIQMTRAIADAVALPVIASGGAGTLEHLYQVIVEGGADAVLVASIAHFGKYIIRQMKNAILMLRDFACRSSESTTYYCIYSEVQRLHFCLVSCFQTIPKSRRPNLSIGGGITAELLSCYLPR